MVWALCQVKSKSILFTVQIDEECPIVPTTSGAMMELRCVTAVLRHGDRTPKQKMKMDIRHPKFFEIFAKYGGYSKGITELFCC